MGQRRRTTFAFCFSKEIFGPRTEICKKNALKYKICEQRMYLLLWLGIYIKLQAQGRFLF